MRYIYQALQALCLAALVSCVQETDAEYPDGESGEAPTATVTLQVGASGSVQTRAYGGDEAAVAGEFMNTLTLFVVDAQGVVEKRIDATADAAFQPVDNGQGGCETDYRTTVTLRAGAKTIYAFSNLEGHQTVGPDAVSLSDRLSAVTEGSLWADAGMESLVVDNPAAKVDLTSVFIPMTARQEVSIPVSSGTVRIELVRLVGKIRPVLTNEYGDERTVTAFSIGNFADRVSLFEGVEADGVSMDVARSFTLNGTVSAQSLNLYGAGVLTPADSYPATDEIYVNETDGEAPFSVTLTVNNEELSGSTVTTAIPRNHYLPLALRLSNFQLEVEAWVSPIGAYPVPVQVSGPSLTDNTYKVALPEGCIFSVDGGWMNQSGEEEGVTAWSWSTDNEGIVLDGNATDIPLLGHVTALSGQTFTLQFEITAPRQKSGTLEITTYPLSEVEFKALSGSIGWSDRPSAYEWVPLLND